MSPLWAQRLLLSLGGLSVAVSVAIGLPAVVEHAHARASWSELAVQAPGSSALAARSDRAYARVRSLHRQAGLGGKLAGLGVVLMLAAWRRPQSLPDSAAPVGRRAWIATILDAVAMSLLGALLWVDDAESAVLHGLVAAAPCLMVAPIAPLMWGRSLGLASQGLGVGNRDPSLFRGVFAIILFPLAALASPLGVVFPSLRAWHLKTAGLGVVATGPGC